jgi:hypothetical protein
VADHDDDWLSNMDEIDQHIMAAAKIVNSGGDLAEAHEELEPVRVLMMEARERNQIEYFLDSLTRFHEPMETLALSVKGKNPEQLDDATVVNMRSVVDTATYLWKKVLETPLHPKVFGLDDDKVKQVRALEAKETDALENLRIRLSGNNKQEIIKAAKSIKPPFATLYLLFGDFKNHQS